MDLGKLEKFSKCATMAAVIKLHDLIISKGKRVRMGLFLGSICLGMATQLFPSLFGERQVKPQITDSLLTHYSPITD